MSNIGMTELLMLLLIVAATAVLVVWPAGRICRKAGFSPWLAILAVVPPANVLLLWFLALAEWPSRPRG